MSGEKCAQARLTDTVQQEITREIEHATQDAAVVARLANLAGSAEELLKEVNRLTAAGGTSETLRAIWTEFTAVVAQVRERRAQIEALLSQIGSAGRTGGGSRQVVDAVRRQRQELQTAARELESLADDLVTRLPAMERGLVGERTAVEYREAAQLRERQRELAGLREEVGWRLQTVGFGSLQPLRTKAEALLTSMAALAGNQALQAADIEKCREVLAGLTRDAIEIERDRIERLEQFARMDDALRTSGFQQITPLSHPAPAEPIAATYAIDEDRVKSTMEFNIYRGGIVRLVMRSASSTDNFTIGPGLCYSKIAELAALARERGLLVHGFMQRDPTEPDGWKALDIARDIDREQPAENESTDENTQQKRRNNAVQQAKSR